MRQKELFDGTKVPAIWQGGGGIPNTNLHKQVKVWIEGIRFGCNAIDTAERYGNGTSELVVGEVLKKVNRKDVFVATKVAPENLTGPELVRACKQSLKRLDTDYIDLYQIHWNNPNVPLEQALNTMMELRDEGKIRHIGVCNFTLPQIEECWQILNGELATVQMEYNLVNRLCERDIIHYCENEGVLFLGYSPLRIIERKQATLMTIALKYRRTVAQVILNWLTSTLNISVIARTTSLKHIIENAQATEFELDIEDVVKINESYKQQVMKIKPTLISCEHSKSGIEGNVPAYKTIEEATENKFNQQPSPLELAKEIAVTKTLSKPVFVRRREDGYELVGGSVRYWAWVLAFGMDEDVECVIT